MMKKSLYSILFVLALYNVSFSQWSFQGSFPDTSWKTNTGVQFLAVDPDGKIWVAPYRTFTDSVFVPDSNKMKLVRPIFVFNPDGTQASFSPIKAVTLLNGKFNPLYWTKYGIEKDHRGNMVVCDYDELVKINYKTGAGMYKVIPVVNAAMCKPGVASNGDVYIAHVLSGYSLKIYDSTLTFKGNAIDTLPAIGRTLDVSKNGNVLYAPRFTEKNMRIYQRPDEFSPFTFKDTVLRGLVIESQGWDYKGRLWISTGSYFDKPLDTVNYSVATWYAFDVANWSKKDSVKWKFTFPYNVNERPRGIAFSPNAKTAYLAAFGASDYPPVQKHFNPSLDVRNENNTVVEGYNLTQNYPNPFNPTTEIKFSILNDGFVSLKVFNILGQEVATLVNEQLKSGNYSTTFDAKNLSTGTYIYELSVNGFRMTNKMLLMK